MERFHGFVLYFVVSGELLDNELRIGAEFDFRSSELDRALYSEECSGVFRHVVRSFSEVFVPLFEGFSIRSDNENPAPCGSGVASGSTVAVDEKFHVGDCEDYSFIDSTPETISVISFVMADWRALLYVSVRAAAFLWALSFAFFMATMRAACSDALASSRCSKVMRSRMRGKVAETTWEGEGSISWRPDSSTVTFAPISERKETTDSFVTG